MKKQNKYDALYQALDRQDEYTRYLKALTDLMDPEHDAIQTEERARIAGLSRYLHDRLEDANRQVYDCLRSPSEEGLAVLHKTQAELLARNSAH
uniref:Uncharacterized protein n=1 Tax=Candidatus Kentrum sp. LFY TaxID=2126342 RepID=A0A450WI61_9GAMM|nr:MAG: hypothetical protein BECKLFY1418C_GA0070996_102538 [Candidatus Kentron sp. LFY]